MKAYGGMDLMFHLFLISALVGGECSVSCPDPLTSKESAPVSRCIGSRVGPRAGLDGVEKRKFLTLLGLELLTPQSSSP
jgi:hypothetical protein